MENKKLTAVQQAIFKTENLIKQYKGMKQNALSKGMESNKYQYAIQEFQSLIHHVLTPLLELENEQIIEAVNKTSQHDCAIANSVLRRLKKPEIFQFDEKGGEQYYNENYGNK